MLRDLIHIPSQVSGHPLFGPAGVLTWLWLVGSLIYLLVSLRRSGWQDPMGQLLTPLMVAGVLAFAVPAVIDPQGSLPIRGYGLFVMMGIVGGVLLTRWRASRMGLDPEIISSLAVVMVLCGFVGARAFFVIEYWDRFQSDDVRTTLSRVLNFTQGGLVVYGSFFGAAAGLLVFAARYKLPTLAILDLTAPAMMLGLSLGRIGCLLNGCCFGGACDLPWAVTFPAGSPPYVKQAGKQLDLPTALLGLDLGADELAPPVIRAVVPDSYAAQLKLEPGMLIEGVANLRVTSVGEVHAMLLGLLEGEQTQLRIEGQAEPLVWRVPGNSPRSQPIHPTQVYSAVNAMLICVFLLAYYPYRSRDGEVMALLLTIYPIARFLEEIIRIDEPDIGPTRMSISQNVSVLLFSAIIPCWILLLRRPKGSILPPRDKPITFAA